MWKIILIPQVRICVLVPPTFICPITEEDFKDKPWPARLFENSYRQKRLKRCSDRFFVFFGCVCICVCVCTHVFMCLSTLFTFFLPNVNRTFLIPSYGPYERLKEDSRSKRTTSLYWRTRSRTVAPVIGRSRRRRRRRPSHLLLPTGTLSLQRPLQVGGLHTCPLQLSPRCSRSTGISDRLLPKPQPFEGLSSIKTSLSHFWEFFRLQTTKETYMT